MPDFDMVTLGNQLRELREQKGWGVREFARLLRKNHPLILKYENGEAKQPTLLILAEIARALGMRFFDLEKFLLTQLPEEKAADVVEEKTIQLKLPFEPASELWKALDPSGDAVAKITCKRVRTQLVITAAVKRTRKASG